MRKVIVGLRDNKIINIIEIEEDANYQVTSDRILVDFEPGAIVGGTYINGAFTAPPRIVDTKRERYGELKVKFREQTATFEDVLEFLADFG